MKTTSSSIPPSNPRAEQIALVSVPIAANEPAPNGERLREMFHHELIEFGPAMVMADQSGRVTWSNAAFRRIAETRTDNGPLGTLLAFADIAEEIDFRQTTIFRDWDFRSGDSTLRLRARFEPLREADGRMTAIAGLISMLQDGAPVGDQASGAAERYTDFIRLSSDWMWETDANLTLTLVTQRVFNALGFVPQQFVGRNLLDFVATEQHRRTTARGGAGCS
jgi:PAS domain-containing protein